jgi:hypothetical protein
MYSRESHRELQSNINIIYRFRTKKKKKEEEKKKERREI